MVQKLVLFIKKSKDFTDSGAARRAFYSPYRSKLMFLKSVKKVPITIFSLSLRVLVILRFDCSTLEITYTVDPQFNKITFMVYLGLKK